MTRLHVSQAGPMVTVQDAGRKGLQHSGVSGSGPMDGPSFQIANALVGNPADSAGLEFAHVGGTFAVAAPVQVAVTGGAVDLRIDGTSVRPWESHHLLPGSTLVVGALKGAVWGYLAISGGIDTPLVLGARATHLRTGIGGHEGRRLQAGDDLPLDSAGGSGADARLRALRQPWHRLPGPIRIVPGPQDDHFDARAWSLLLEETFIVSASRDRMAQMLDGPLLVSMRGHDIVSDGTVPGSIQVPGSGRPIVLMAERQTTGGYPKIATIASVDLPRLAQMPSGQGVRFQRIAQSAAEDLRIAGQAALDTILTGLADASAEGLAP